MNQYSFLQEISLGGVKAGLNLGAGKAAQMLGKNARVTNAVAGAGVGALGGAVTGLKKDENGERHILRNAAIGGAAGGAVGAAFRGRGLQNRVNKFASKRLDAATTYAANNPNSRIYKWVAKNDALRGDTTKKQMEDIAAQMGGLS